MKISHNTVLLSSILILSCSGNDAAKLSISEEQFIILYADVLVLKEENMLSRADSLHVKNSLDSLYASFHVTASEFDASLQYYRKDIPRWKKFYEDVTKRLESLQQKQIRNVGK